MTADFQIGDYVEVICRDNAYFKGVLTFVHDDYIVSNGYGFALDGVKWTNHA
jgi:hypothetical protein